ncbi:hypothetical protein V6Z11_1Z075500 [Gossypium hirsutum]
MPQWLSQHQRHFRWPTTPRNESFDPDPRLYSGKKIILFTIKIEGFIAKYKQLLAILLLNLQIVKA